MLSLDLHQDTQTIADLLASCPNGGTVALADITAAIGRDITGCRYLVYGAMRVAERDSGAVFASVRGVGYRRLLASEIAEVGQTARAKIRRAARHGVRTISAGMAGANDIAPDAMRKILAEQSALGMLEHMARDKNLPKLTETDTRPLPLAVTARAFLRSIGALPDGP